MFPAIIEMKAFCSEMDSGVSTVPQSKLLIGFSAAELKAVASIPGYSGCIWTWASLNNTST